MPSAEIRLLKVWPYFLLAGLIGVAALIFLARSWGSEYPAKDSLVKISGEIATIAIRDDFSDSSAGALLPAYTSVYFTLKDVAGEFRYPYSHPKYVLVRDNTSDFLNLWVVGSELGSDRPIMIWQLLEDSTHNYFYPNTSVTFEEVIARLVRINQSIFGLGRWLAFAAVFLALTGRFLQHRNRKKTPAKPIESTAISTDWSRNPKTYTNK